MAYHRTTANTAGYTVVEILAVLFIASLATAGVASTALLLLTSSSKSLSWQSISTHRMEVRSYLKKEKTTGTPFCMDQFAAPLTGDILAKMIQSADNLRQPGGAKNRDGFSIPLGKLDFTNPLNTSGMYGESLEIQSTELTDFKIVKELSGFVVNSAAEIQAFGRSKVPILYIISASLTTTLNPIGRTPPAPVASRVRVNFAIEAIDQTSYRLLDCGATVLARSTAFIESCKAFGEDFEYVHERSNGRGQCYMPIYDPTRSGLGSTPNGQRLSAVTGYTPFRAFLCEGAFASKSVNFPFFR